MLVQVLLEPLLGVGVHGADLEHRERAAAQAGALLLEDGPARARDPHRERRQHQDRPRQHEPQRRRRDVERPLRRPVVRPQQVRRVLDGESAAEVAQLGALDREMLERPHRDDAIEVLLQQVERGLRRQFVAGEDRDLDAAARVLLGAIEAAGERHAFDRMAGARRVGPAWIERCHRAVVGSAHVAQQADRASDQRSRADHHHRLAPPSPTRGAGKQESASAGTAIRLRASAIAKVTRE